MTVLYLLHMTYIEDMSKFKTDLLNKLSDAEKSDKDRVRQPVTMYLHRQNFKAFKKLVAPLSPSQVFDAFILETIGKEKKKEKK